MNQLLRAVLIIGICCSLVGVSKAQPPDAEPPVVTEFIPPELITRVIKLRNIQPELIAWWIRPETNPEPELITSSRQNYAGLGLEDQFTLDKNWFGKRDKEDVKARPVFSKKNAGDSLFILGLSAVTTIPNQHRILAYGTKESLDELENIVAQLDKTLEQVEVSFFHIFTDDEGAKALGASRDEKGQFNAEPQSLEKFKSDLEKLSAEGKVSQFNSSYITTIIGSAASIGSSQITPISTLNAKSGEIELFRSQQNGALATSDDPHVFLKESHNFFVAPVNTEEEKITVFLNVSNPVHIGSTFSKRRFLSEAYPLPQEQNGVFVIPAQTVPQQKFKLKEPEILLETRTKLMTTLQVPDNKLVLAGAMRAATEIKSGAERNLNPKFQHQLFFVCARISRRTENQAIN